ncbi:uncharacterized protein LOC129582298 [Paramacrobiotus metropolitanus]|uniref:uncharacterized protein LOC129582298 n=1 Tax=Paramacrobiotus metropolitanus TaxID=2943436 RepID=UPI0024463399|nr:uncharacterized protein LOC129582298 [Paramacrobiotus metropolitanus]
MISEDSCHYRGLTRTSLVLLLGFCLIGGHFIMAAPVLMDNGSVIRRDSAVSSEPVLDGCDWVGTLDPGVVSAGSVQHVTLRCASGRIRWLYPDGAVRLTLHPPSFRAPTAPTPRRICLTTDLPDLKNVLVFLQHERRLQPVFAPQSAAANRQCFALPDTGDTATLYLESFYDHRGEDNHLRNIVRLPVSGAVELLYDISEE